LAVDTHQVRAISANSSVRSLPLKGWTAIAAIILVWLSPDLCHSGGEAAQPLHLLPGPIYFAPKSKNRTMIEARTGYLWGVNALLFRDGDNGNSPPGKKEISLESPLFGIQGEGRIKDDLAVRVQGWINLPQETRGDSVFDRTQAGSLTARSWDTQSRYLIGDISLAYQLGPFGTYPNRDGGIGMPYSAGLVAGYRYNNFDYQSTRSAAPAGTAEDHIDVHVPYIGVHYANENFAGSLVRLDILASPVTLSKIDAERQYSGERTEITGQSVSGFWFGGLFAWSWQVSERAFLGIFVTYNYLELSGGATVNRVSAGTLFSTRFSLDSVSHVTATGLTGIVTF